MEVVDSESTVDFQRAQEKLNWRSTSWLFYEINTVIWFKSGMSSYNGDSGNERIVSSQTQFTLV